MLDALGDSTLEPLRQERQFFKALLEADGRN